MKTLLMTIIIIYSMQGLSFSWSDTEAGYFPQGFSCMTNEEKVNFKYFLAHAHSGKSYDSYRIDLEKNPAVRAKRFYDNNLAKEDWLCPAQALSISNNYELEKEKTKRGEFRRQDIIHSISFTRRGLIMGPLAGDWGLKVKGGLYNDRVFNLDYKDGRLEGDLQTGKVTVRPLVTTSRHRFIVVSLYGDQHVICYPKSMHKECNPFKPAPLEQLAPPEKTYSWPEDSAEENVQQ